MSPQSYFWKSFFYLFAIVLVCSLLFGFLIYRNLAESSYASLQDDLRKETDVLATLITQTPSLLDKPEEIARAVQTGDRLTLIAPDGTVLADNWALVSGLTNLENHANRPEFKAAMQINPTYVRRFSETVQSEMLYYAVPIKRDGKTLCVLRLSFPLSTYLARLADIRNVVILAALFAVLLTLPFAYFLSRSETKQLKKLHAGTKRLAKGDLSYRIPPEGNIEFQEVADDFNKMADELNQKILTMKQEHSQTEALLSRMVEGVLAIDRNGRAVFANNAFCSMFNLHMERIKGKTFLEISRNAELSEYIAALLNKNRDTKMQFEPPEAREIHLYQTSGEKVFSIQASPIQGNGETPNMVLLVFHDITGIKRVEQVRKDFVANVSHELRTPLTALIGSTEALLDGAYKTPEESKKFLEIMDKQLRNTQNLVKDMLALAAAEDTQTPVRRENVDLKELVSDIMTVFEPLAQKKNQTLQVQMAKDHIVLNVDPRQLSDALSNLVDNAIKYSDEGGMVELKIALLTEGIQIIVKDNGPGIPKDQLSRIFERFYRVDKSRSKEMGGTGLGLAIAKHAVENHCGTIKVESSLGQGTQFVIHLPQNILVLQHP
jgi:two-component system phosphate regulon sensor histidine kinase PhoR